MTTLSSWNNKELEELKEKIEEQKKDKELDDILYKMRSWNILKWFALATLIFLIAYFVFKVDITKEVIEQSRLDDYYLMVMENTTNITDSIRRQYSIAISDTLANKNVGIKITINFKE